jgi:hypothetical protein
MFNPAEILIDAVVERLQLAYRRNFGDLQPQTCNVLGWTTRLALENVSNADTLYHNMEHTIMVTLAGQQILRGKHLREGGVTPHDWLHYTMALLCHDIGFVRGVCSGDDGPRVCTGIRSDTVQLPDGATDAALMPYHVDRARMFVRERFGDASLVELDVDEIESYIEMTRFPIPDDAVYRDTRGYGGLTRAADLIGQLGDPDYLRKLPALFYELLDSGVDHGMSYASPHEMRQGYARFYWDVVRPYIGPAVSYLQLTQEGRRWIAGMHKHVFDVEHGGG